MRRQGQADGSDAAAGILTARPTTLTDGAVPGLHPLGLAGGRDGLLYVPAGYRADRPAPLAVLLHGAGGDARGGLAPWRDLADDAGTLLLAPESRGRTWDVILDDYGRDIAFLDAALARVFAACAVDAGRIAVGGFSDGASYALSVGIGNGDLFTHLVAFAPGFAAPARRQGMPAISIAHGTRDAVLPIDRCSRRIVPQLERAGYAVRYTEFDGPHTVPPEIARAGLEWFLSAVENR